MIKIKIKNEAKWIFKRVYLEMAHRSFCRRPRSETTPPPPPPPGSSSHTATYKDQAKDDRTTHLMTLKHFKNDSFPRTTQKSNGLSPFSAHSYPPRLFHSIPFSSTTIPLHYTRTPLYDVPSQPLDQTHAINTSQITDPTLSHKL